MNLGPEAAAWARHTLIDTVMKLRVKAGDVRSKGAKHMPMRQSANYVAAAYEEAAVLLNAKMKAIRPEAGEGET